MRIIIFSDLDGSLLDHDTYSHAAADKLLSSLDSQNIPVIPSTSKTFSELRDIREELGNPHPFVVENGAAVYIPGGYFNEVPEDLVERHGFAVKEFVQGRSHWQVILQKGDLHLNDAFLTFQQAGAEKIAEMTGLNIEDAQKANDREYGEPLKWLGTESQYDAFKRYIKLQGGTLLKGGRFIHLSGECDKGKALQWLMSLFCTQDANQKTISIALGDSHNDVAMIERADYGILIRSPVHEFPVTTKAVFKTKQTGAKGWVEGITHVFNTLGIRLADKASL